MNKQQLKEAVGELNLADTVFESGGVSYIDTAVSVTQVYDLIDQLEDSEKVYVVELSNDHLTNYLAYDLVYKVFFISQNQEEKLNKYKKKFTEKEIKDYDERYWLFSVEVAE